jgi:hypothetical protein
MTLTIGLLRLADAVPALVAAILYRGAAARLGPLVRAVPVAIPRGGAGRSEHPLGLAAAAVAVRRAGGPGATLAVVTGWRDRQLPASRRHDVEDR